MSKLFYCIRASIFTFILFGFAYSSAFAQGASDASQASADLSTLGLVSIVEGASTIAAAGSTAVKAASAVGSASAKVLILTVTHLVQFSNNIVQVTFSTAIKGSSVVLNFSRQSAAAASLAVGQSVQVVAISTGYLIESAGKIIGYIPNKLGQSLLHSSSYN